MRWPEATCIPAVGSWLPTAVPTEQAVADGRLSPARAERLGYRSICVDETVAPPDMARRAAAVAAARAGLGRRDVALLLHCSTWFQGLDIWPTASYVAADLFPGACAIDLQQRCNGALAALELAAAAVHAGPSNRSVMITTADRFAGPGVDRWDMHEFNVYADGAAALVLGRSPGFARLLSTVTVADNGLEGLARGDAPFTTESRAAAEPIDLITRGAQFTARTDDTRNAVRIMRTMTKAAMTALRDAGRSREDLTRVVTAATGRLPEGYHFHSMIGVDEKITTWEFGSGTGHVGAGDWFLGLEHLMSSGEVGPGDTVLLFGGGAGYSCTAAVLEILAPAPWASADTTAPIAATAPTGAPL